jgi:hypothetical protein
VFWSVAIGDSLLAQLLVSIIPFFYRWRGREQVSDMMKILRLLRLLCRPTGLEGAASRGSDKDLAFSCNLEQSLHRALALSDEDRQKDEAIEYLLLALIDDPDVAPIMAACNVDREKLRRDLSAHIEGAHENSNPTGSDDSKPTAGLKSVLARAVVQVRSTGGEQLTGAGVLVSIFAERQSQAVACRNRG